MATLPLIVTLLSPTCATLEKYSCRSSASGRPSRGRRRHSSTDRALRCRCSWPRSPPSGRSVADSPGHNRTAVPTAHIRPRLSDVLRVDYLRRLRYPERPADVELAGEVQRAANTEVVADLKTPAPLMFCASTGRYRARLPRRRPGGPCTQSAPLDVRARSGRDLSVDPYACRAGGRCERLQHAGLIQVGANANRFGKGLRSLWNARSRARAAEGLPYVGPFAGAALPP